MAKAIAISEIAEGDCIRTTVLLDDGRIFFRWDEKDWKEITDAPWMRGAAVTELNRLRKAIIRYSKGEPEVPRVIDPDKPHRFVSQTGGGVPTDRPCGLPGCNRPDRHVIHYDVTRKAAEYDA